MHTVSRMTNKWRPFWVPLEPLPTDNLVHAEKPKDKNFQQIVDVMKATSRLLSLRRNYSSCKMWLRRPAGWGPMWWFCQQQSLPVEVALRGRTDFCQSTGAGDEHGNSAPGCAAVGKEGWRCFFCSHGKRKTDTLRQHRENAIDAKAKIIVPVTAALRTVDVINVIKRDIYRRHAGPAAMFPLSCAHAQSRTALAPSLRTANLGSALKKKKNPT